MLLRPSRAALCAALVVVASIGITVATSQVAERDPEAAARARYRGSLRALKSLFESTAEDPRQAKPNERLRTLLDFFEPRAYPYDNIDWGAYARAVAHVDRMPVDLAPRAAWVFMGPTELPPPPDYSFHGSHFASGRVNSVAISPHNSNHILAGLSSGGVLLSRDNGATWADLTKDDANWKYLNVTGVQFSRTNANVFYAGAGDFDGAGDGFNNDAYHAPAFGVRAYPNGLFKCEFVREVPTWTQLAPQDGNGMYFEGQCVSDFLVDPDDPRIITVTTGRGLGAGGTGFVWRYNPDTSAWEKPIKSGANPVAADWFDIDISVPEETPKRRNYFVIGRKSDGEVLLYRSKDRGKTWEHVRTRELDLQTWDAARLSCSSVISSRLYITAGREDANQKGEARILRSNDANKPVADITWNAIDQEAGAQALFGAGTYNPSQASYDIALQSAPLVSPTAAPKDMLYASLITVAATADAGRNAADWVDVGRSAEKPSLMHNDQHALAVDPANPMRIVAAHDAGLTEITYDPRTSRWKVEKDRSDVLSKSLGATEFYATAHHPRDPAVVLGAAQDNAMPIRRANGKWAAALCCDGSAAAINPSNPDRQFVRLNGGDTYRTYDNWKELAMDKVKNAGRPNNGTARWLPPLIFDVYPFVGEDFVGRSTLNLYTPTDRVFYRRLDDDWRPLPATNSGQVLSATSYIVCVEVAKRQDIFYNTDTARTLTGRTYTGSLDAEIWMRKYRLHRTGNAYEWYKLADPTMDIPGGGGAKFPNRAVSALWSDPLDNDVVYVGYSGTGSGHVYRMIVDGTAVKSFTDITGAGDTRLPDLPVNSLTCHPTDPSHIFAATDIGVFSSPTGNGQWARVAGVPQVRTTQLTNVPGNGHLFAATFGKGLYGNDMFQNVDFYGGDMDQRKGLINRFYSQPRHPSTALVFDDVDIPAGGALIGGFFVNTLLITFETPKEIYYEVRKDVRDGTAGTLVMRGFLPAEPRQTGRHWTLFNEWNMTGTFPIWVRPALPAGRYHIAVAPVMNQVTFSWPAISSTGGTGGRGAPLGNGNSFYVDADNDFRSIDDAFGDRFDWSIGIVQANR